MEKNEGQVVKKVDDIKATEYRWTWKIKNYSLIVVDTGDSLDSSHIYIRDPNGGYEMGWYLKLYPNGYCSGSKDFVSVQLYQDDVYNSELHTIVAISVLNDKGIEFNSCKKEFSKADFDNDDAIFQFFIPKETLVEKSNELLPNDQLTILCKIIRESKISKEEIYETIVKKRRMSEFDDFEKLLKKAKFSDVEIVVDNQVFEAHKAILSARSRVFEAMFEHNMKEQTENKIMIGDVDAEVMELVLRYMYTGKLELDEIERLRPELYMVADKYELDGLKYVCKDTMINNLSLVNIGNALTFIDMLPDSEDVKTLEKTAIDFVIEHSSQLMGSDSFKKACKSLSTSFLTKIIHFFMLDKY